MAKMRTVGVMIAALGAAPVAAAPAPATVPGAVHRLTDAQVASVLDQAAAKRAAVEQAAPDPGLQIHGEVGVEIGTGGYRSAYGTAVVPLGEQGVAIISLSTQHGGERYRDYDRDPRHRANQR